MWKVLPRWVVPSFILVRYWFRMVMNKTDTSSDANTIPKLIRKNALEWGNLTAMCKKQFGIWQRYTWHEYYETVKYLSLGFDESGAGTW